MDNQEVIAKLNNLRIAPRKVMMIVDVIRGRTVLEAKSILTLINKKAALPIKKLLDSAIANAKNNFQMDEKELYIFKITVDQGPKLKRWIARARGQANEIQKKTSHVTIILRKKTNNFDKKITKNTNNKKNENKKDRPKIKKT